VRKLTSGQIYAMKVRLIPSHPPRTNQPHARARRPARPQVLSKQQLRDAAAKGADGTRAACKMDWEAKSSEDFERELSERRHLAGIINIEKAIYKHWMVQSLRAERRILEVPHTRTRKRASEGCELHWLFSSRRLWRA
jgi:hypothetical protein